MIVYVLHRLGIMFWSDVSHKTISSAQLNGTGPRVLVNTGIDVPGDLIDFCTLSQAVIQYQYIDLTFELL